MVPHEQSAGWTLLIAQLFVAAMSVPLIRGRVRRNTLYGLRTRDTLADDRVWYEANRITNWALLVTSLFCGLLTALWLSCFFTAPLWALTAVWVVSLVGVTIYGVLVARRLRRESPDSG